MCQEFGSGLPGWFLPRASHAVTVKMSSEGFTGTRGFASNMGHSGLVLVVGRGPEFLATWTFPHSCLSRVYMAAGFPQKE